MCLEGCRALARGTFRFSVFLRLFGFVALTYHYRNFVVSLGTDMMAATLMYYALVRATESLETNEEGERAFVLVAAATVLSVTIKLSMLPGLLLPVLLSFRMRQAPWRTWLRATVAAVGLGVPFLVRSYVLTGYVVYPQTLVDLFAPDRKVPVDDVRWMTYYIREFAIGGGSRSRSCRHGAGPAVGDMVRYVAR